MTTLRIQFPDDFGERYLAYKEKLLGQKIESPKKMIPVQNSADMTGKSTAKNLRNADEIYYNQKTAVGDIDGREFRFKPDSSFAKVFSSLWGMIGTPLKRQEVLILADFYEEGQEPDPARRSAETLLINNTAKSIRSALKIGPKVLINNDGNLTLLGKKVKSPKLDQAALN